MNFTHINDGDEEQEWEEAATDETREKETISNRLSSTMRRNRRDPFGASARIR